MEQILITGGAGFIGSHLTYRLIEEGHHVTVYDTLDPQVHDDSRPPAYLHHKARLIKGDVCDYEHLKSLIRDKTIIIHLASMVGNIPSAWKIKRYWDVNVGGTANIIDLLANEEHCCKKLILASSMACYGEGKYACPTCGGQSIIQRKRRDLVIGRFAPLCEACGTTLVAYPTDESFPLNPVTTYGQTKKVQEDMALNFSKEYRFPVVILRYFSVYGPYMSLTNRYGALLPVCINRFKRNKSPIIFEDGLQTRDFISVHDAVEATVRAMYSSQVDGKIYNVGSGKKLSINELVELISIKMNKTISPCTGSAYRRGDVRNCCADISAIASDLDFSPSVGINEGLSELLEWADSAQSTDYFDKVVVELRQRNIIELN